MLNFRRYGGRYGSHYDTHGTGGCLWHCMTHPPDRADSVCSRAWCRTRGNRLNISSTHHIRTNPWPVSPKHTNHKRYACINVLAKMGCVYEICYRIVCGRETLGGTELAALHTQRCFVITDAMSVSCFSSLNTLRKLCGSVVKHSTQFTNCSIFSQKIGYFC